MKFVVFSDLHIHPWVEFGADQRLDDCISVLTEIRAYCIKHKISDVFFGGDLFHVRGVVRTKAYVRTANELALFKEASIAFHAAVGNHDMEDAEGAIDAMQPLMRGGLINGVSAKGWRAVKLDGCTVTMFSYCDSREDLAKRIVAAESSKSKGKRIALFHHGFKGARVGSTLEYEVKEPIDAGELRLDKRFDLVLSGHYHTHQAIVGIDRGWYVGSPLEHTRSDRCADAKGFLVVDTADCSFERVSLNRPRFVSIGVGGEVDEAKGNFVDVSYEKADEALEAFLVDVRRAGARGVNLVPSVKAQKTKQRLDVSPSLSPAKVIKRYVKFKKKSVKRDGLDRAALVRLGLELVNETVK